MSFLRDISFYFFVLDLLLLLFLGCGWGYIVRVKIRAGFLVEGGDASIFVLLIGAVLNLFYNLLMQIRQKSETSKS